MHQESTAHSSEYHALRSVLLEELLSQMDFSRDISDEEVRECIAHRLKSEEIRKQLPFHERTALGRDLFATLRGLDILQELVDDNAVTEIMVNGPEHIFVEKSGRLFRWQGRFTSSEKLQDVIRRITAGCNRTVNESSPIVDARLSNGSRVNVVINPIALNGPILTIRRFPEHPITMEALISMGAISEEAAAFLSLLVRARYNIFISGGTGSGKTTFLNALSAFIPTDERLITIEDSAELQIRGISNLVRLETRSSGTEGCSPITIRDLIRTSLRMRPDRIIVGEVRGGEALDLITGALNCGHDGSMSTGHANSAADMLARLETMMLMSGMELPLSAIRRQIASGVDIIVHLGRLRDKSRKVLEITEVLGMEAGEILLSPLFSFEEEGTQKEGPVIGTLQRKGVLQNDQKLRMAGLS